MATTTVGVCNSALIKIGADRISSLTQDTRRAILLNAIFELTRDDVLRAHPWKFAVKRVTLAPNSTVPAFGFDFTYDLPSDCLRPLDTDPDDIDYVVETDPTTGNKVILTDEDTLNFRYIWKQTDPTQWDANFEEALAWKLAHEVAYALTQSATLVDMCDKKYEKVLAVARSMSAVESPSQTLEVDTWTGARRKFGLRPRW